jgi:hypothetical protein
VGRARRAKKNRIAEHPKHSLAKLSERLVMLIQPYRDDYETRDTYQKLITVASVGWNLDLLPGDRRAELLERTLEAIPVLDRVAARNFIIEFVRRKQELFPEDRRFIANATVIGDGDRFRVQVASLSGK